MQRNAVLGLALVELVLAYEWLSSGLTKLVRGDFPSGLAAELHDASTTGTYAAFLQHVVIPHAALFAWSIQLGEVGVGVLFVAAALTGRPLFVGIAAAAGAFMTLNFGLAAGDHFFRVIAADSFDEGVPLDVLATWLQLALVLCVLAPLAACIPVPRLSSRRQSPGSLSM
jgi:thiosulfate dehydrogenase (quinone) large subunit